VYLDDNNLCRLNPVKPDKCRTFPFEWTNPDSNAICPELAGDGGSLDRINKINRIKI
jgi:Fe-S-cluster containining protein